jgi:hypothetical protein
VSGIPTPLLLRQLRCPPLPRPLRRPRLPRRPPPPQLQQQRRQRRSLQPLQMPQVMTPPPRVTPTRDTVTLVTAAEGTDTAIRGCSPGPILGPIRGPEALSLGTAQALLLQLLLPPQPPPQPLQLPLLLPPQQLQPLFRLILRQPARPWLPPIPQSFTLTSLGRIRMEAGDHSTRTRNSQSLCNSIRKRGSSHCSCISSGCYELVNFAVSNQLVISRLALCSLSINTFQLAPLFCIVICTCPCSRGLHVSRNVVSYPKRRW